MRRLSHKRQTRVLVVAILIAALGSVLAYSWYFQTLPQPSIYLLDDVHTPGPADRILVFSPHPDDETIGAGGYIAQATQAQAQVWIVLVTNGNKRHLEEKRYQEFEQATATLGVPQEHLVFLEYPDGSLARQNLTTMRQRFQSIIENVNPTVVITPYPADSHPDHATVGRVSIAALDHKSVLLYEYLVHHPGFPQPRKFDPALFILPPIRLIAFDTQWQRFVLNERQQDLKHQAVLQYRTQLRVPGVRSLLLSLVRENELFAVPRQPNTTND